ncbi:MAG TPA: metallophosphoesterase family protein [Candidatus Binatia bacterium]
MATRKQRNFALEEGRIGLISDTHGLVRPEALAALKGVELIVHAGDIGKPEVLKRLQAIAPLAAIKGNNDTGPWARHIPEILDVHVKDRTLRVIHYLRDSQSNLRAAGIDVVISGHSHKPSVESRDNVLFVNPGSAGPRRFKLPVTVGLLLLENADVRAEIIHLL